MSESKEKIQVDAMSKVQLAVKIEEQIRTDLKIMAIRKGITMNELVEQYLSESLTREKQDSE